MDVLLILCRYSDRVKAETERLDNLDLDDLEVLFSILLSSSPILTIMNCLKKTLRFSQMDEDERYNRKLESGLYTLQVFTIMA